MFLCFLETARNMTEFYAVRDSFHTGSYTQETARNKITKLKQIAERELENSLLALELLRSDRKSVV